jgi:hypothetical protein
MAKINHLAKILRGLTALAAFMAVFAFAPNAVADETIAVIENDGTMFNANGTLNTPNIVRRFYANHSDAFDFVVIFTSQTHQGTETAWRARNDVTGIGGSVFPLTPNWGSAGKVLTGINMMNIDHIAYDISKNNRLYRALVHEISHTWLVWVGPLPSGTPIRDGATHFLRGLFTNDRCTGIMRDTPWISNPDGTWSILTFEYYDDCLGKFHPFGLYLMGFENPANITQTFQLLNGTFVRLDGGIYYENGVPVALYDRFQVNNQTLESVSINDVITAGGGARSPSYATAPKQFSVAYILLTEQGEQATTAQLNKMQTIASTLPAKWAEATSNLSSIVQATGPTLSPALCKDGTAIGDANGDGAFTTADEDIVGAIYAGNEVKPSRICCIDINQNGTISLADWVKARRIVAGLDPSPGTCATFP